VTREGDVTDPLVVNYTVGGTAKAGINYTALPGHVTIPAGQASTTIGVVPIDENLTDPRDTVVVTLTDNPTSDDTNYKVGTSASATVEIKDNNTLVKIEATKPNAAESGLVAGEFTLTRRADIKDALEVEYTVSGTAKSGVDFVALPGKVTFPAGAATVTVPVQPLADAAAAGVQSVIVTVTPNDTGSEYRYLVESPASATVLIADEGPVTIDAHAKVENRPFDSTIIMLPRPIAGASYNLAFWAKQNEVPPGGGDDGTNRYYHWSIDNAAGFALKPDNPESDESGHAPQSTATGTIESGVQPGAVYTVTVWIHTTRLGAKDKYISQKFSFYNVEIAALQPPVLVGGLDDNLHETAFRVKQPLFGIPDGDLSLKLESNQDYGVNKKPMVFQKGTDWYFRSSDKAFAPNHDTDFDVGAYVTPKLTGYPVKVATAKVAQNPGDYRISVVQPAGGGGAGKIYANGAIKIQVQHLFLGKPTNHAFDVEIPDDLATPIGGTGPATSKYSDEFQIRGESHGTGGTLTTEIIKLPPTVTDPLNRIYNFVKLNTHDPLIFDESGKPMSFNGGVSLTGAEPSFWRSSPAHGNGQRGTFWNWATVVGQPGSGFKGTQESTGSGTYGESETWHGTDYATDDNVTGLGQLDHNLVDGLNDLAHADRDFKTWQDKLKQAVAGYELFKAGFPSFLKLQGIYSTITSLLRTGRRLAQTIQELEKSIALEKDPVQHALLVSQLKKASGNLDKLHHQVDDAIANRDEIIDTLPGFLANAGAPYLLVQTAAGYLDFLGGRGGAGAINPARQKLNDLAGKLAGFQNELAAIINGHPQKSADPDETLKREYLLGAEGEGGRIDDLLAKANDINESIDKNKASALQLASQIQTLNSRVDEANANMILATLDQTLQYVLSRTRFTDFLQVLDDFFGIKTELNKVIDSILDKKLFQTLDSLAGDISDTNTAANTLLDSTKDTGDEARGAISDTTKLYRVWITPTVEFPESVLNTLKPKPLKP
jgi:hypothetical protein